MIIGHQKINTSNATSHIIKILTQNTPQAKMQNNQMFRKKKKKRKSLQDLGPGSILRLDTKIKIK